ncbi:MAG: hypothetical protein Q9220_000505 [cf. Caloplaca sp. 1 TL-2023]
MSAKRVEPILRDTTPEPKKPPKSAEPPMPVTTSGPQSPQETPARTSQIHSPASTIKSHLSSRNKENKAPSIQSTASIATAPVREPALPTKSTDPIIAAREVEAKPPIPVRSPSRKPSFSTFTERARFHLTRRKSPLKELNDDDTSSTHLPIQSPPSHDSPADRPSSPVVRRLSTRRANAISISTYSASPTSTARPHESSSSRGASPVPQSESKPSHSSYNSLSFLPLHPQLSPLPDYSEPSEKAFADSVNLPKRSVSVSSGTKSKRSSAIGQHAQVRRSSSVSSHVQNARPHSVTSNADIKETSFINNSHPRRSSSINIPHSTPILDDAGGSVNLQHPLLREARHAKFASTTTPSTPARESSRDLPLRHYRSQDNFHSIGFAGRPKEVFLPKRTSSLLYNPPPPTSPSAHPALSSAPLNDEDKLSPAPAQSSATPAPLKAESRPGTRTSNHIDSNTTRSSPATVSSGDSEGATPPPIGRGARSPTPTAMKLDTNLDPTLQSSNATSDAVKSPLSAHSPDSPSSNPAATTTSPTSQTAARTPKYKTSATNNIPFYLNPVSSAALIDFLASTPPPSPPHPARSNTDPNAFDAQNLYRNYRVEEGKSPVPPGPGGMPMLPLSLAQAGPRNAQTSASQQASRKAVWKRMFGAKGSSIGGAGRTEGGEHEKSSSRSAAAPPAAPKSDANGKTSSKQKRSKKKGKKEGGEDTTTVLAMGKMGILSDEEGNGHLKDLRTPNALRDAEEMSQAESATTTSATVGRGSPSVNGGAAGGQSFMGVGKDGMWISRKNFLRT